MLQTSGLLQVRKVRYMRMHAGIMVGTKHLTSAVCYVERCCNCSGTGALQALVDGCLRGALRWQRACRSAGGGVRVWTVVGGAFRATGACSLPEIPQLKASFSVILSSACRGVSMHSATTTSTCICRDILPLNILHSTQQKFTFGLCCRLHDISC